MPKKFGPAVRSKVAFRIGLERLDSFLSCGELPRLG